MIKINKELGSVKCPLIVELGTGDVLISSVHSIKGKYTGIAFSNDTPQEIATKHNCIGVSTDDIKPDAIITFTDIRSIEVMERALTKAKIRLRNF